MTNRSDAPLLVVLGSLRMDFVVQAERLPSAGETVVGREFHSYPGGFGAGLSAAAARLGARVSLVGAVGRDGWGSDLHAALVAEGVDVEQVIERPGAPTGVGLVAKLDSGSYAAVVGPGAGEGLTRDDLEDASGLLAQARVVLASLELSGNVLERAFALAGPATKRVLVARPARELDPARLREVDLLVASRRAARRLAGVDERDEVAPGGLVRRLAALGPKMIALWLGPEGALLFDGRDVHTRAPFSSEVADRASSDDAFAAALGVAVLEDQRLPDALAFATAAASLAAQSEGPFPSLPRRETVEQRLENEHPSGALPRGAGDAPQASPDRRHP